MYNPDILDIQIVGRKYCRDGGNSAGLVYNVAVYGEGLLIGPAEEPGIELR